MLLSALRATVYRRNNLGCTKGAGINLSIGLCAPSLTDLTRLLLFRHALLVFIPWGDACIMCICGKRLLMKKGHPIDGRPFLCD